MSGESKTPHEYVRCHVTRCPVGYAEHCAVCGKPASFWVHDKPEGTS